MLWILVYRFRYFFRGSILYFRCVNKILVSVRRILGYLMISLEISAIQDELHNEAKMDNVHRLIFFLLLEGGLVVWSAKYGVYWVLPKIMVVSL